MKSRRSGVLKRACDIIFGGFALVASSPVLLASIVAIRLDSPGAALYRQSRMGKNGREFKLVKLRGMYIDAPQRFPELYEYSAISPSQTTSFFFHTGDGVDPRVTRVGKVLRRYSIDELPNFWNVVRGDMSIVGPRPEIPELAHLYGDNLEMLLSVKPGVTSPAKAWGRDDISFSESLERDLDYVRRESLALDIKTIAATAWSALRGSGVK